MACLNPRRMIPYPKGHPKFGQYRLIPFQQWNANEGDGTWIELNPTTGEVYDEQDVYGSILVPCRKCRGCLLDKSKEWATRLVLENYTTAEDCSYFITLTYRDDDLVTYKPTSANGALSLSREHIKKFLKDFRRQVSYHYNVDSGVRYFIAGEYGSTTFRPHYHLILFGFKFDDLECIGTNFRGEEYFRSPFLEKVWNRGFVCIAKVTYESCAYVARYTLKKADNLDREHWLSIGVEPEFQLQSTHPGLGLNYFIQYYDEILGAGQIVLPALNKDTPNLNRIPGYFIRKLEEINPELFLQYKDNLKANAQERQISRFNLYANKLFSDFGPIFDESYLSQSFLEREKRLFEVRDRKLTDGMSKFLRTLDGE